MGRSFELDINGADNGFIRLPAKSSARLSYFFAPQATTAQRRRSQRLLIFLSGIDGSKAGWQATISRLAKLSRNLPPMLAYDRYGIGDSDHDPSDVGKSPEEYHDAMDSMRDLRQLIIRIAEERLGYGEHELHQLRIVFCAHSLGCCIARLYSHQFPGTVEALLLVDSAIAGTRADKFTPDPDIPAEWEEGRHRLPKEATPQMCRRLIQGARNSVYSGNAIKTRERIKWSNMPQLLPFIDAPKLQGPEPGLPLVTVLMNDPDVSLKPISKVCRFFHTHLTSFTNSNSTGISGPRIVGSSDLGSCGDRVL